MGLSYLRDNESFNPSQTVDYIIDNSIGLLNLNNFGIDLLYSKGTDSINLSTGLKDAVLNNYLTNLSEINTLILNDSTISSTEKEQIQSIQESLDIAISNNNILYLNNQINDHINLYENTTWGENQGELISGYLYIMKGSLEYWNGEINQGGDNNKQTFALVQVDAAGYLYGWFKAWAIDKLQNENDRIKAGLNTGLQFSFVRGLGYVIK